MQYFKFIGRPCVLGRFGAVKKGQIIAMSDMEADTVRDSTEFKAVNVKEEDPAQVRAAMCYDVSQQDRQSLALLAEQLKDDGYPIHVHYGQSHNQLVAMIQRALEFAPEAFTGEYRALYDSLDKETDAAILAKGELAGIAPNPRDHTRREIIGSIVRAKQQFDIAHDAAVEQLATLRAEKNPTDSTRARIKIHAEIAAKVWPLAAVDVPPEQPEAPANLPKS